MTILSQNIGFKVGKHSGRQITALVGLANLRTSLDDIATLFKTSPRAIRNFLADVNSGNYQGFSGRTIGGNSRKPNLPTVTKETLDFYERQLENPLYR